MTTWRQHLIFDPVCSRVDRWSLWGGTIHIRFRMASGPEHVVDMTLEDARLRMLDGETFATAPREVEGCVGRIEFVMRGAPEHITDAIRAEIQVPTKREASR